MNIVFLGDSVTQGCFEIVKNEAGEWGDRIEPGNSYVELVGRKLKAAFPEEQINIINSGIAGHNAGDALERLEKDVLSYKPFLTCICFGLNDCGRKNIPEFTERITEIMERTASTGSRLVYMTPNMLNTYVAEDTPGYLIGFAEYCAENQNGGEMDNLMQAARDAAARCGARLCDAYARWKEAEKNGEDTTALLCNHINHPSREMHGLFADMLFEIISEEIRNAKDG